MNYEGLRTHKISFQMLSKSSNPFFAVLSCPMCPIHVHWWDTSDRIGQRGQDRTIWRAFGGYFVCPKASIANNHYLNNGVCLERSFCFHKSSFVGRSDLVSDPCPTLSDAVLSKIGPSWCTFLKNEGRCQKSEKLELRNDKR